MKGSKLNTLRMLSLSAGLSVQNEHFDAREPLYDDSNVNFRGNQVGGAGW